MSGVPVVPVSSSGLTLSAYPGDGALLLGYSLEPSIVKNNNLAGFAIQCTPPSGQPYFLLNRLNFTQAVTSGITPKQHTFTSSNDAPFQKFHWVHFPPDVTPGAAGSHLYKYKVITRFCQGTGLVDGPSAEVTVDLNPQSFSNFEFGVTRGYVSSQAYASKFKNADIRPKGAKTLDYDAQPFQPQYEWLGFHARKMVVDLLDQCLSDPSITVDVFAYDIDEPDIVKKLQALGPRLRAFLDNAPLHTGKALEVKVHDRLVQSAGQANVKQGHFKRFAHDKIIIVKKNGKPVKVLTGSANFSVRGLYVQANNVLLFNDPDIAGLYEQVFESVFQDMKAYSKSALAAKVFPFPGQPGAMPKFSVSFAPHQVAAVSLKDVQDALNGAKSSVMFAVMALAGKGTVLSTLQNLHASGKVFSYGMTQNYAGFTVYQPGRPGVLVPFAALIKKVPPPFHKEFTGGSGQVIHDKFIVVDFNDSKPIVFTGSSNLAEGGETSNGDNLLAISDPVIARAFAVEAIRLVDHFHFRAAIRTATKVSPLMLTPCDGAKKWWARDYEPEDIRNLQRELLAGGPTAITAVPSSGLSSPATAGPATKKTKKRKKQHQPRATSVRSERQNRRQSGKPERRRRQRRKKRRRRRRRQKPRRQSERSGTDG